MTNDRNLIYAKPWVEKTEDLSLETQMVIHWIGQNKTVLETGCHTGQLASWLKKNGCQVTGIELNELALGKAVPSLERSIHGDLENPEVWADIKESTFNAVTFIHVLEHLREPEMVLKKGIEKIKKNGVIIIGLPNISNAKDRFDIFKGKFEYTDIGVMDRTHLRFYNQKTAKELIENAGLEILEYYSSWQVNPIRVFFDHLPFFWRLARFFPPNKPPRLPRFNKNLTDVVMLFKCQRKL